MRLGLLTAAFPKMSLEEVADWMHSERFGAIEVACWPVGEGPARRYAGVSHIDVARLDRARAADIRAMLDDRGLVISSLGYYPNALHPDPEHRKAAATHLKRVIEGAALLDVGVVGTFVGRDPARSIDDSFKDFKKVWPGLVAHAEAHGVKIAIENCPMLFSRDEWPGGNNLAYSPANWRRMFDLIDSPSFGLNFDPSHLVWQMIDIERAIDEFAEKIFHAHAKDLEIDRDGLYANGVMSAGVGWQRPRLPGLGEVRWDRFFAALYRNGYDHVVSIEHEDRQFERTTDLVKRGFLIARDVLSPYIQ